MLPIIREIPKHCLAPSAIYRFSFHHLVVVNEKEQQRLNENALEQEGFYKNHPYITLVTIRSPKVTQRIKGGDRCYFFSFASLNIV
jgi:hypothetical protein